MSSQVDFKKEWDKTKKKLAELGQEVSVLAKKSEKEIVKLSKKGKLHLDSTTINMKMEHIYYLVGKEYVKLKDSKEPSAKLKKLMSDFHKLEKQHKELSGKIKGSAKSVKRAPAKKKKTVS